MLINLEHWNVARKAVEISILKQKRKIRKESDGMASGNDWALLLNLKNTATRLYAIRATANGKEHGNQGFEPAAEFAWKIYKLGAIA